MKKYNVGIIGYGWAAEAHIAAINATTLGKVTSVCSSRSLHPAELAARHGHPIQCFQDMALFLAQPDLHVVSVCSFPQDHLHHASAAAKAGKHLIIEKPLALTWEGCQSIQQIVQASGVRACVCFECRYSSQLQSTRSIIERGLLGKIHYGEVDYYHGIGPWYNQYRWNTRKEAGGSSLLSAGCHALDALLFLMGQDVEVASSYTARSENKDFARYEYPTTSVTILKFKDGRVGKVASVIDALQPYYFRVHLVGSEGSLLDNKFYSTQMGQLDRNKWSTLSFKMLDSGDASDHPYQAQFEAFFQSLLKNEEMPWTNLTQALKTHAVIFAADSSAQRHERSHPH